MFRRLLGRLSRQGSGRREEPSAQTSPPVEEAPAGPVCGVRGSTGPLLTEAIDSWLDGAPAIDVSDPSVREAIRRGIDELFDRDDLVSRLATAMVFAKPPLVWRDSEAIHHARYESVLAKVERSHWYRGSVRRADDGRVYVDWTPEAFYTDEFP